jgi:hypothetical protein
MTTTPKEAYPLQLARGLAAHASAGSARDGVVEKTANQYRDALFNRTDAHGSAVAVISSNVPLNLREAR